MTSMLGPGGDEQRVPWFKTYGPAIWRIAILFTLLVALVALRRPCAEGVAGFIGNFGAHADAGVRN
jgi:hypothetical protein